MSENCTMHIASWFKKTKLYRDSEILEMPNVGVILTYGLWIETAKKIEDITPRYIFILY